MLYGILIFAYIVCVIISYFLIKFDVTYGFSSQWMVSDRNFVLGMSLAGPVSLIASIAVCLVLILSGQKEDRPAKW